MWRQLDNYPVDTRHLLLTCMEMDATEAGWFTRLWLRQFLEMERGAGLPDNRTLLGAYAGVSMPDDPAWEAFCLRLDRYFPKNGHYRYNPEARAAFESEQAYRKTQSEHGKLGGRPPKTGKKSTG